MKFLSWEHFILNPLGLESGFNQGHQVDLLARVGVINNGNWLFEGDLTNLDGLDTGTDIFNFFFDHLAMVLAFYQLERKYIWILMKA